MERCFIIEREAQLYKDYYVFRDLQNNNNEIIKRFVAENMSDLKNINDFSYVTRNETFSVILNNVDYEQYKEQLKQKYENTERGKLYTFKKNSVIGKLYTALNIKPAHKPFMPWYVDVSKCRYRLFDYENVLYATLESNEISNNTHFPTAWKEISKSEFYAIIDRIEREENNDNTTA